MGQLQRVRQNLYKIADMCHVFAVRGPNGVLLIDGGELSEFEAARANLLAAGLDMPQWVLTTHCHYDHTESCRAWRDLGAKIAAHELEVGLIENGQATRGYPCPVDLRLRGDDDLDLLGLRIKAWHAPGHSRGSIAYEVPVDGERWLFTGDLVMPDLCPGWMGGFDRTETIATLKKLARLCVNHIGTGHCIVEGDGTGMLVDSLAAAYDGTWRRCFIQRASQFPGGTVPKSLVDN